MPQDETIDFPDNPKALPKKIRRQEEMEFEDLVLEMDRLRRVIEFNSGSPNQEDASASGKVTVASGTTVEITIQPEKNHEFLVSEVGVNPNSNQLNFTLEADDISTDANNLYFGTPFTVRNRVRIVIENPTSGDQTLTYFTNARQVKTR